MGGGGGGGGGGGEREKLKSGVGEMIERFEILVGMDGERCEQLSKIVDAAGKNILTSRL